MQKFLIFAMCGVVFLVAGKGAFGIVPCVATLELQQVFSASVYVTKSFTAYKRYTFFETFLEHKTLHFNNIHVVEVMRRNRIKCLQLAGNPKIPSLIFIECFN